LRKARAAGRGLLSSYTKRAVEIMRGGEFT
jgi:hypothetical protein